jgi:hypothetical protein
MAWTAKTLLPQILFKEITFKMAYMKTRLTVNGVLKDLLKKETHN